MQRIDRTGEVNVNKYGTKMKIVEYYSAKNIIVEFQDEHKYRVHTEYKNFKEGAVRNVYDKSVYGVGMFGEGKYNRVHYLKLYNSWQHMLRRCYDPYTLNVDMSYIDCFVDERFHNLQDFGKWFEDNYYEVGNELMCLDKDILVKNNKIYSPETCVFVPERINKLFIRNCSARGKLPIGIHKRDNRYIGRCNIVENGKEKRIVVSDSKSLTEAFLGYKDFKETYIKAVANTYKDRIPDKVYNAMINYRVEWDD